MLIFIVWPFDISEIFHEFILYASIADYQLCICVRIPEFRHEETFDDIKEEIKSRQSKKHKQHNGKKNIKDKK